MMKSQNQFTKALGWILIILLWAAIYQVFGWVEELDIPNLVAGLSIIPVALAGWWASFEIMERFDIHGRK